MYCTPHVTFLFIKIAYLHPHATELALFVFKKLTRKKPPYNTHSRFSPQSSFFLYILNFNLYNNIYPVFNIIPQTMEQSELLQRFADNQDNIFSSDGLSFYRDIINRRLYFIFAGDDLLDELDLLDEFGYRKKIHGVIVLSSVESIPMRAFEDYQNLQTVEFQRPSKVRTIGKAAFKRCSFLDRIDLSSVEYVGDEAFNGCTHLNDVTFGPRLLVIGEDAFYECAALISVIIPRIRVIGVSAFRRCLSLESAELPEEIHSIEEYAFAGNRSLSHLVIPSTHSGDILSPNAFYGCNQISQVDMRITDQLIPYIGTGIYQDFNRLTNVFRATYRDKTTALIRLETSMTHRHRQYITSHYQSMDVATLIISRIVLNLTSRHSPYYHIDDDVVSSQSEEESSIANIVSQRVMSFLKLPKSLNITAHDVEVEYNYDNTIGQFVRAVDVNSSSSSSESDGNDHDDDESSHSSGSDDMFLNYDYMI